MRSLFARIKGCVFSAKCKFFRKNIFIDKGLLISKKLKITGDGTVRIGKNCLIDGIKGDDSQYVTIDTYSPQSEIIIGDNCSLYAARISSMYKISIDDNVLIEETTLIDTDFHSIDKERGDPVNETNDKCKISIGSNVCIGVKSLVLKGVKIGDNVIVLPGSIVSLPVGDNSIVIGNPARKIK